jgi:hypothetical protein
MGIESARFRANVLGCTAPLTDHPPTRLQSLQPKSRRSREACPFEDVGKSGLEIDRVEIGIACLQAEPPANGFAVDYARPVWLAADPAKPAPLQPVNNWHETSGHMGEQVTVSALPRAAFVCP